MLQQNGSRPCQKHSSHYNCQPSLPVVYICCSLSRQKEPMYFEIQQPTMRLQYNSAFNIFLRHLAAFAALPDPARSTSRVTAHSPTHSFPPHPVLQQAGKWTSMAHNTAEHQRATGKITHVSPQRAVWAHAKFNMWNLLVIGSALSLKLVSDMRQNHPWLKPDN